MATKRSRNPLRRRERPSAEPTFGSLAHLLERKTHDDAATIIEKTPPTVFGIRRSSFLMLASGLADLAGQVVGRRSEIAEDLDKAKATLGLAGVMALAMDGPGPKRHEAIPSVAKSHAPDRDIWPPEWRSA